MLLEVKTDPPRMQTVMRRERSYTRVCAGRRWCVLCCDRCQHVFEVKYYVKTTIQTAHFCSRRCSQAEHQHARLAAAASSEVRQRARSTTNARFGVDSVLSLPSVHALSSTTEANAKRHETLKRNGSYAMSKREQAFGRYLVERFGEYDVERQVTVGRWRVDFRVRSIDTYVQFDGEYWHGLDRSLEMLRQSTSPRDRAILGSWERDRIQDAWFTEQGLRLIRVTDGQFKRGEVVL